MSEDEFVFKPCIQPGTGASGPVNVFGQHNFVVLRKIAENPGVDLTWLRQHLTLSDTRVLEVVNKLMFEGHVEEMATDCLMVTPQGKAVLEKL